ncbi:lys-63-specific deubiquitinase BRCC36-like [Diorhabda carinulata]|uniref:lys-63-specific deubiquitinase BRCC36-like n=1 Tax=Diorhabda sublineata TaxID=1163346 RepID=UPI0024E13233|nr:lys-63-specific deubiquitinase BRCC36-like [Diorhabda sublineata]XP_057657015.1 lys-63-specific deubiquitinase BRCC36-like [Diorhabda carinulata]
MLSEIYLKRVNMTADVYAVCVQHALTTEKQEIMGLLIGEVDENERTSNISACVILHRSDKQPDRVEISPEQLCTASMHADQLANKLNRPMRVLGWYHSHPHITVWPSHVDIRTQAMYQTMDPLFVGLVFSVFQNNARSRENQIQVTCFQAVQEHSEVERREIELVIQPSSFENYNLEGIANLPKILIQEEVECHDVQDNGTQDELSALHNDAFKTLALVHIVCKISRPLCDDLEQRKRTINQRVKELENLKKNLN